MARWPIIWWVTRDRCPLPAAGPGYVRVALNGQDQVQRTHNRPQRCPTWGRPGLGNCGWVYTSWIVCFLESYQWIYCPPPKTAIQLRSYFCEVTGFFRSGKNSNQTHLLRGLSKLQPPPRACDQNLEFTTGPRDVLRVDLMRTDPRTGRFIASVCKPHLKEVSC